MIPSDSWDRHWRATSMGTIWVDPFASLVRRLAQKHGIKCFVETGTYMGDGARFAATVFPRVVTIEISGEFQQQAIARSRGRNIEFLLGDSASILPGVVSGLEGTTFFWLDGHAGAGFYGGEDNCPLAAELDAISASPPPPPSFLHDAPACLPPPPPPFNLLHPP